MLNFSITYFIAGKKTIQIDEMCPFFLITDKEYECSKTDIKYVCQDCIGNVQFTEQTRSILSDIAKSGLVIQESLGHFASCQTWL